MCGFSSIPLEKIFFLRSIAEVFLTMNGERHYLWRAVDQDDNVLDILVQRRRNKRAAKKFRSISSSL
jgi:transposase-like protein